MENYYKTLGVSKSASSKDISLAFRRLARKYHPDVNKGSADAEDKFKQINQAYDVLGDAKKRKDYDSFGEHWKNADQIRKSGGMHSGTHSRTQGAWPNFNGFKFGGFNIGDLFGQNSRESVAPSAIKTNVEVSLAEVATGTSRTIQFVDSSGKNRRITITVPPGISDGAQMVFKPRGVKLNVTFKVTPASNFTRHLDDLHTFVKVPLKTAVLGGTVSVQTLQNKTLELKIPAGTQNLTSFKIKNKGLPNKADSSRVGDLIVKVDLRLPSTLSKQFKKVVKELPDS